MTCSSSLSQRAHRPRGRELRALSRERTAHHPWRTYVERTRWWRRLDLALYAAALLGAMRALLTGSSRVRRVLAAAILFIVARSLLHAFAVPALVGQRYLAEVMPIFGLLGACLFANWKNTTPEK